MAVLLNSTAVAHAKRLIANKQTDMKTAWRFSANDENALLGDNDWSAYSTWHLGQDAEAGSPDTKAHYKYAFGKNGKVYRSALIAIRQRAAQQGVTSIFNAAGELLQALDESVKPETFAALRGVEIFRPGTHHGRTYTDDDMTRMARNSNRMLPHLRGKLRIDEPTIKIGHQPANEFFRQAAMGVATQYYTLPVVLADGRTESRVYADFENVPNVVADAIKNHFPERSVEKYKSLPDPLTQELVEDVIASVAFLGTIPPEVKSLASQYAVLFDAASNNLECELFGFSETLDSTVIDGDDDNEGPEVEVSTPQLDRLIRAIEQMVMTARTQAATGVKTNMDKKQEVKARWMSGATDEEILREFGDLPAEELQAWKAAWEEEKAASGDDMKGKDAAADKTPQGFSAPAPKLFSESQVADIVKTAVNSQIEQFSARLAEMEKVVAAANHKAKQAEHEALQTWYNQLKASGLPASIDALSPVMFAERLNNEALETFAEGQPQQTMQAQFKQMLEAFAAATKLTEKPIVPPEMKSGEVRAQGYQAMLETYQAKYPNIERQQLFYMIAKEHPEVFSES